MKQFIIDNAQWIFSGVGVAILVGMLRLFLGRWTKNRRLNSAHFPPQSITAGHASTNVQTGNDSTVLISTNHLKEDGIIQTTNPIKIDNKGGFDYKTKISEGDYQEFIWGATTVRISITEIVKTDFEFLSNKVAKDLLGAIIYVSTGGGIVYGGKYCKETGVNQFLVPQKKFDDEVPYSVYNFCVSKDSFRFFRLFIDHVNQHNRQVTLDIFFAEITDVKKI
ncbi:MAG: hypothetical protein Q8O92_08345 [Candidatus Latescibacter sp.]|nr:hypothetical protein [Candidatus Latescibacter sp.]